jgi:hypothetical protein
VEDRCAPKEVKKKFLPDAQTLTRPSRATNNKKMRLIFIDMSSNVYPLFKHIAENHGLTISEGQLSEIVDVVRAIDGGYTKKEIECRGCMGPCGRCDSEDSQEPSREWLLKFYEKVVEVRKKPTKKGEREIDEMIEQKDGKYTHLETQAPF